jgi:DNA polymerase III epsilon subunit-like protein
MTQNVYIVIDLETTGVHVGRNRIVSIAARLLEPSADPITHEPQVEPHVDLNYFYSFVNPEQPNYAREINKVSDEFLTCCKSLSVVGPLFCEWINNVVQHCRGTHVVLVGHNIDGFDEPMLWYEFQRIRVPFRVNYPICKIDSMKLCKYILPTTHKSVPYGLPSIGFTPESYRQTDIYTFLFGEKPSGEHDALGDVNALVRILNSPMFERVLLMCSPEPSKHFITR